MCTTATNQFISFVYKNGVSKICIVLPTHTITVTIALILFTTIFAYFELRYFSPKVLMKKILFAVFATIKCIPIVKRRIQQESCKIKADLRQNIHASDDIKTNFTKIPEIGFTKTALSELAHRYSTLKSPDYYGGRVSGAVFNEKPIDDELNIYKDIVSYFAWSNPLWPKIFPGVRKMEAEVVRMTCTLLNGDNNTCGTMSSGGSMSIILACLAHRNRANSRGINKPEIILPSSAHAAFFKAAKMFSISVVEILVAAPSFTVNVEKVKKAISSNTAMIVASAPNFPYGTIDDVEALGQLALKYNIPLHVDACCGGFILPFLKNLKYKLPPFDFSVPGVTSISADTHKYGLTPKGSSVICYRSKDYLHHQYYCHPEWQGGIYASSTLEGSRGGINIAMTWATLLFHGFNKYKLNAINIVEATRTIRDGIKKCQHLVVLGSSDVCVVSFTSTTINIYRLHDLMLERGWQLSVLQSPPGVHLMVTPNHSKKSVTDLFIKDTIEVADIIAASPDVKVTGSAALYGLIQKIPDKTIVSDVTNVYLDVCYETFEQN